MRISEDRADRITLRSSDIVGRLLWTGLLLALAVVIASVLATTDPDHPTGLVLGALFCLVAAVVQLARSRTLRVELRRVGPGRWSETTALVRRRERELDTAAITGLTVSTTARFNRWGSRPNSTHPGPTVSVMIHSTLTAQLTDGRPVPLGWTKGLWSREQRLRRDAERLASTLRVPVR